MKLITLLLISALGVYAYSDEPLDYGAIRPTLIKYCASCHPGENDLDVSNYLQLKHFVDTGALYKKIVLEKSMPKKGSREAASITDDDRNRIGAWAAAGGPAGSYHVTDDHEGDNTPEQCMQCHNGTTMDRAPLLAGQNKDYILMQLVRFRKSIDTSSPMRKVALQLTPDKRQELAEYFSNLKTTVNVAQQLTVKDASLYQIGESIAKQSCVSCHLNENFKNRTSDSLVPALAGQPKDYLLLQLDRFQQDKTRSALMRAYTSNLSADEIEALATYFSLIH